MGSVTVNVAPPVALLAAAFLPACASRPWSQADIAAVGAAGRATYSSRVFTMKGDGADIWGTVRRLLFLCFRDAWVIGS